MNQCMTVNPWRLAYWEQGLGEQLAFATLIWGGFGNSAFLQLLQKIRKPFLKPDREVMALECLELNKYSKT